MSTLAAEVSGFPDLLRYWRGFRRLSQLDLAVNADVSQRHVSFLESGRSKPSRDMVLQLAESLELPLRERNRMLGAAGWLLVPFPSHHPGRTVHGTCIPAGGASRRSCGWTCTVMA